MDHPSSRFRRLPRLAALGLCLLGTLSHPLAAPAAINAEVCQRDASPGDADWTCANPGATKTTFWVPHCTPGDLTARVKMPNLTFVLLNTDNRRMLSAVGSAGVDILVGSPNTSDILSGLNGKNTYVMGGSNGFLLGRNDRAFVVSTSSESDWADLTTTAAEYVYISATGQGGPSSIPTAASPGAAVNVRGSNELDPSQFAPCDRADLNTTAPEYVYISATGQGGVSSISNAASPLAAENVRVPGQLYRRTPFPGSPSLRGFVIGPASEHRILLPANDFLFLGRSLQGRKEIPMLLVDGVRFSTTQIVDGQKQYEELKRGAKGLGMVASKDAPLVYFRQNGLLVFSQNGEPLGSAANPGLVIARLLDRNGKPLQIKASGNSRLFQARFLIFTAPQDKSAKDQAR
jgi:hypothetical protein